MMVDTNALIKDIRAAVKELKEKLEKLENINGVPPDILDQIHEELKKRLLQQEEACRAEVALQMLPLKIRGAVLRQNIQVQVFNVKRSALRQWRGCMKYHRSDLKSDSVAAAVYDICEQAGLKPGIYTDFDETLDVVITNLNP